MRAADSHPCQQVYFVLIIVIVIVLLKLLIINMGGVKTRGGSEMVLTSNKKALTGKCGVEGLFLLYQTELVRRQGELALVVLADE